MVEGAPMRFPGGTFSRYAVLSLGWGGRYTRERTEHWTHARARTSASRSAHGIFHVPVFSILRRFMGRFFRGHGSGCPGTEQSCAPFLAAPAIQEGRFFIRVRAAYVIQEYFPGGCFEMQLRGSRSLAVCYCSRFRNPSCDFQSSSAVPQRMVKRVMPEWGCRISRSETGSLSPSRTIAVLLPLGNHSAWTLSVSSVAPPRPQAERAGRMPGSRKNADRMETVSLNSVWKAISLFL